MKKVLVTGGCGFIGHHFVEHILKNTDWGITVLDGLTYAGVANKLTDIESFDTSRVKILWHDLRASISSYLASKIGYVNYIVNFASNSDVEMSITQPRYVIENNVSLITNLLDYVRDLIPPPQAVIHISTDEVYGAASEGVFFKEWDRHLPSNPYAASKSAQEAIGCAYWRTYGIPLIISTTMNNFGERQHPAKLVPKTIRFLQEDYPVPIHAAKEADGTWKCGKRTWLHARNHADAILFILNSVDKHKWVITYRNGVDFPIKINIAGETELTNLEVVCKIANAMGMEPKYHFVDFHSSRPGHDMRYALDGSFLKSLGWKPPLDVDECFRRTVQWTVRHPEWLE